MIKRITESGKNFLLGISTSFLFLKYVACVSLLEGPSMLPTFNVSGDIVLVNRFFDLKIGNVLVYKSPVDPNRLVIKRVLGLPGDIILHDNKQILIPKGHIWFQGDNYGFSNDSRAYGPVSIGMIQGKIEYLLFPHFKRVGSNVVNL
jgi:inner membrane protease subunit 1